MLNSQRTRAILQALFVTLIWSSSWVIIKVGLKDIPPLLFAGLRYTLAALFLLPFAIRQGGLKALSRISKGLTWRLLALGLVFYTITQGAAFLTLANLEAVTFSLMLNFSAIIVALLGIVTLKEVPTNSQWLGMLIFLGGVFVYFTPFILPAGRALGLTFAAISVLANAIASLQGRGINRSAALSPLMVTVSSMGIGGLVLLLVALLLEGFPPISTQSWLLILLLAVVNTAFAFTLWNRTLQTLSAVESSIINNTMLVQIAILAWLFLGETISLRQGIGLAIAFAGILLVQLRQNSKPKPAKTSE